MNEPNLDGCEVDCFLIDRRRIVGPSSRSKDVMDGLQAAGFVIVRSGPYTDREMFPRVDTDRFLFIAERETEALP